MGEVHVAVVTVDGHTFEGQVASGAGVLRQVDGEPLQAVAEPHGVEGGEGGGVGRVGNDAYNDVACLLCLVLVVPSTEACHEGVERHGGTWRDYHGVGIGAAVGMEDHGAQVAAEAYGDAVVPRLTTAVLQPGPALGQYGPTAGALLAVAVGNIVAEGGNSGPVLAAAGGAVVADGGESEVVDDTGLETFEGAAAKSCCHGGVGSIVEVDIYAVDTARCGPLDGDGGGAGGVAPVVDAAVAQA